ncbi:orotidine-5'-phosphate decarboxylase [Sporolactobacillus sp. CPB3-1]|uniref:Orotidine 5'-phosphate decarboxylase n=1 Tax=Sporolactobacillus mangiferae TaxID=2940498 RepID=A0ABT0M9H3_9BACL|nr:orotidine-5'-phosphate decarboxylase [Sporolactobacillus mangiferae]MCL1630919.1 orotidine-5'-phosphate decarboxylase [Sporolactobacillus mangiferae]
MNDEHRIIVALDVSSQAEMLDMLNKINRPGCYVKIGMELYLQQGADIVRALKSEGYSVFLDLKLHDIPHTVYRAMKGLAGLGADMINVHAAGGVEMMQAAVQGLGEGARSHRPICLAVTQLTSTDQAMLENELLINRPIDEAIASYASLAYTSGLDGVVCSAWEAKKIKSCTAEDFLAVTPGIRLLHDDAGDQKRVASPAQARSLGSDYIVVGRSITAASDPAQAYERVLNDWRKQTWTTRN